MVTIESNGTTPSAMGTAGAPLWKAPVRFRAWRRRRRRQVPLLRSALGLPDPGGIACRQHALADRRPKNLRGLGVTARSSSLVVLGGAGRFRPHVNGGYEWWSDRSRSRPVFVRMTLKVRHQIQYAAGVELEATPKLTLIVDFLGQPHKGGGKVGYVQTLRRRSSGDHRPNPWSPYRRVFTRFAGARHEDESEGQASACR